MTGQFASEAQGILSEFQNLRSRSSIFKPGISFIMNQYSVTISNFPQYKKMSGYQRSKDCRGSNRGVVDGVQQNPLSFIMGYYSPHLQSLSHPSPKTGRMLNDRKSCICLGVTSFSVLTFSLTIIFFCSVCCFHFSVCQAMHLSCLCLLHIIHNANVLHVTSTYSSH